MNKVKLEDIVEALDLANMEEEPLEDSKILLLNLI